MSAKRSLKALRQAKGISQEKLAELAGVSWMTIQRAEKQKRWPLNASVRQAVEKALGVES